MGRFRDPLGALKKIVAGILCLALVAVSPGAGLYSAWASEVVVHAPTRAGSSAATAVTLARSINVFIAQPGSRLSDALSVEGGVKLGHLLKIKKAEAVREPAAALPPAKQGLAAPAQALENLRNADEILRAINWPDLHDPEVQNKALQKLAPLIQSVPPAGGGDSPRKAFQSALAHLRPKLKAVPAGANPWDTVFDGFIGRLKESSLPVVRLVAPWSNPKWRGLVLKIMTASSLRVSRTAVLGRKYGADAALTHDDVMARSAANFKRAAEYAVDHAKDLPINLQTASAINAMLTEGLVFSQIQGDPYFNGDSRFKEEVRLFYEWLDSPQAVEKLRSHPVEMAERIHYAVSFLDSFPDGNGRTARLLADLILIKAGLAPAFYTELGDYFQRGAVRSGKSPQQRLDYFREAVEQGQVYLWRNLGHSSPRDIPLLPPSEGVREKESKNGHESMPLVSETRGSAIEFMRRLQETPALVDVLPAKPASIIQRVREGLATMPASFKLFLMGGSLIYGASVGIGITMSIYGISKLGLLMGMLPQAVGLIMRIPGSLIGAKIVGRFDARKIYVQATIFQGLQLLSLPLGLAYFGAGSAAYIAIFIVGQAIYGLIYGATYGMADREIVPRLAGTGRPLETANFILTATRELFSVVSAFIVSPVLLWLVGADHVLYIYAALIFAAVPFLSAIKFPDGRVSPSASMATAASVAAPPASGPPANREYIPFISAMFLHFGFYTLWSGVFALFSFPDDNMHQKTISLYVLGRCLVSFIGAMARLSANGGMPASDWANLIEGISPQRWFTILMGAGALYLLTGALGLAWLHLAAAAVLGVATAMTAERWMSRYQNQLPAEQRGLVAAKLNSLSVVSALVPFAVISGGRLMGAAIPPLLLATAAACALALIVSWMAARRPPKVLQSRNRNRSRRLIKEFPRRHPHRTLAGRGRR